MDNAAGRGALREPQGRVRRTRGRWLVSLAGACCLLALAVVLLGYGLGDATWWLVATNVAAFWLLAPAAALTVLAAVLRRPVLVAVCALVTACWMGLFVPLHTGRPAVGDLRIATYNVDAPFEGGDVDRVLRLIDEHDPDVVVLQQMQPWAWRRLTAQAPAHPHRWYGRPAPAEPGIGSIAVLSRHPIVGERPLPSSVSRPTAVLTLDVAGQTVQVAGVHLRSPIWQQVVRAPAAELTAQSERRRAETIAIVAALHQGPVAVAGDLNSGALSDPWTVLHDAGLRDAHDAAGSGPGFTRFLGPFGTRIDAVFSGGGLVPQAAWTGSAAGSDHRPVLVDLELPD